ncbi:MAG: hypothetical protein JW996_02615 [Candidatus Cloacimonetes bacterium]|nr:hypothetical protein [Candidatus Cloacimonadota bacterium]
MNKILIIIFSLIIVGKLSGILLQEVYETAPSSDDYDKYLELETGVIYEGGLLIGKILSPITNSLIGEDGLDVMISGNGAILDLKGEQISISFCENRLDIENCIILNGNIRFRGINAELVAIPQGSVKYVTFYRPHDYGIRLQGTGEGIILERNLVIDAIDTGYDYIYTTGISSDWIPTGSNIAISIQAGFYGTPEVFDNWSYHSTPQINTDPLKHISAL